MIKTTLLRGVVLSSVALTLMACGNLSKVSDEGTTDNPIFPALSEATFHYNNSQVGSWVNWDNVRQIEKGMNKDQLYHLIGRPHFSEGLFGVREWDYVFNYRENGEHKVCQYKILFDKKMNAQSFLWYPNGCNSQLTYNLSGDFLFDFNQDTLTEKGLAIVDNIATELKLAQDKQIKISGYTDRLGSVEYNLDLSQRRANQVKARLAQQGVVAQMEAVGYGKANQVKICENEKGQALRDCLRPNRRVEILVNGGILTANKGKYIAGVNGPAILYQTSNGRK